MIQGLVVGLIGMWAVGFAFMRLAPAAWRAAVARRLLGLLERWHVDPSWQRRVESKLSSGGSCGSCRDCKACQTPAEPSATSAALGKARVIPIHVDPRTKR